MPKRTLLLISALAGITLLLLYFALTLEYKSTPTPASSPQVSAPQTSLPKTARVYFEPSELKVQKALLKSSHSASLMIDPGVHKVTAVQLELQFDPNVIETISLEPASGSASFFDALSPVLFTQIDREKGRISYAVGISPNELPRTKNGVVANLFFTLKSNLPAGKAGVATPSSQISFL